VLVATVVLGVYLVTTFISDPNNPETLSGQGKRIGERMIEDMKKVEP